MLSRRMRSRLEDFIDQHAPGECAEEPCVLQRAKSWVHRVLTNEATQEREMMLLALAFEAYRADKERSEEEIQRYQAAIAALVAKSGGVVKIHLDDVEAVEANGGTMTSFVAPDGASITYRIVTPSSPRS